MNILGNTYGSWKIIEDNDKKVDGYYVIKAQCHCGTLQDMQKSPFVHGSNSSKCFKCHLKLQKKSFTMCTNRVF